MPRKKILPTIVVVYDEEGLTFLCDGEPIEDMEFGWDDLSDPELLSEVAEELVEYIDSDDLEDVDNPLGVVVQSLRQLRKSKFAQKAEEEEELDDFDDFDDDE